MKKVILLISFVALFLASCSSQPKATPAATAVSIFDLDGTNNDNHPWRISLPADMIYLSQPPWGG